MSYTCHNQGNVSLHINWKCLHESYKTWPGFYLHATIYLEIKEVGALEGMEFICD